jgi:hypothetical protein
VERGHLIRPVTRTLVLAALVFGIAAPAGAAVSWRVLADGTSAGTSTSTLSGYVALTRTGASKFSARLGKGTSALAHVDWSKDAVVAVFGEFGCEDHLVGVSSITQRGTSLRVVLVEKPPPPGTAECMAIYGTYRVLAVPRATLRKPFPIRAVVTLAGS